jgi:hypothetical protein
MAGSAAPEASETSTSAETMTHTEPEEEEFIFYRPLRQGENLGYAEPHVHRARTLQIFFGSVVPARAEGPLNISPDTDALIASVPVIEDILRVLETVPEPINSGKDYQSLLLALRAACERAPV